MEIRTMRKNDCDIALKIWQDIFEESDSFVQWLFANRFFPGYSSCAEAEGAIVSVIHAMPLPLRFHGNVYKGAIIGGVATVPPYRGLGLMKKLMAYEIGLLKELGIELVTHTPVNPAVYYSCDQYLCTKTGDFLYEKNGMFVPELREFDLNAALAVYRNFASRYDGIVWRDKALMTLRRDDFYSDNIRAYMLKSGAYCFADIREDGVASCMEFAYFQEAEVQMLLEAIPARTVTGRLPADYANTQIFKKWNTRKHAVLYPLNSAITAHMPSVLSPGKQMELMCEGLNGFIWEEY